MTQRLQSSAWVRRLISVVLLTLALMTPSTLLGQEPGTIVAADRRVQGRTYVFPETGKTIPYALFVPSNYDAARKWPLIVGLHGAGRPYDWLMGYQGIIDFAQQDGYIIVTPLGYHPRGYYGSLGPGLFEAAQPVGEAADKTLPTNLGELSEKDVMNVLEIVRRQFTIDEDRIYLFGHSMGGAGTYHLAAKYPTLWAALAVAAPGSRPLMDWSDQIEKFRHIPILLLHGDADKTIPVAEARKAAQKMKAFGMQYLYVEIKGGDHTLFISKNRDTMRKVFAFFDIVRKNQRPQTD